MMQYYSYVLMFVVFDVASIFCTPGEAVYLICQSPKHLPIIGFLAIIFAAFAFALHQAGRKNIW